jgi:hypothetical protein
MATSHRLVSLSNREFQTWFAPVSWAASLNRADMPRARQNQDELVRQVQIARGEIIDQDAGIEVEDAPSPAPRSMHVD